MVKTLSKYLISSVICVDGLQLLDLLAIFGLHRIKFVSLSTSKRLQTMKNYAKRKNCQQVFLVLSLFIFGLVLDRLFELLFKTLLFSTSSY